MTISRSNVLKPFLHQRPMQKAPPMRPNARASDHDVASVTGGSGPISGSHNARVHHERIGDHRGHGAMSHTGSENSSVPPKVQGGRPQQFPAGGNGNGDTSD
jgi:hypothetical protein